MVSRVSRRSGSTRCSSARTRRRVLTISAVSRRRAASASAAATIESTRSSWATTTSSITGVVPSRLYPRSSMLRATRSIRYEGSRTPKTFSSVRARTGAASIDSAAIATPSSPTIIVATASSWLART